MGREKQQEVVECGDWEERNKNEPEKLCAEMLYVTMSQFSDLNVPYILRGS